MSSLRYVRQASREFLAHWGRYLFLSIALNLLISEVAIPVVRWLAQEICTLSDIPYISYNNLGAIAVGHPVASVGLLLLLVSLLLLAYLQFAFLLIAVDNIRLQGDLSWRQLGRQTFGALGHLQWRAVGFFLVYFILIIPFAGEILQSPFLSKITIPAFILDYIGTKWWLGALRLVAAIIIAYLGTRLLQTLPLTILAHRPLTEAAAHSWHLTRHRFWFYFWRIAWISLITVATTALWDWLLISGQRWLDGTAFAFAGAMVTTTLLMLGTFIINGWTATVFLLLLISPDGLPAPVKRANGRLPRRVRWFRGLTLGALAVGLLVFNLVYLNGLLDRATLTISHRGVDHDNGVQNTIPALAKTSREKPDYVEMDIHETKDDQFVVMHDENLEALTGVNKTPRQLTLARLTQLTAKENGHQAKVASFDDYLKAAEQHHQKLIVEYKSTPQDSPGAIKRFIKQYASRLLADHDRVHSLDYRVIQQVKRQEPQLYASFILPYVILMPHTAANAYTLEETTLSDSVISQIHDAHKQVWAWTVDDPEVMTALMFQDVDGIITDELHKLQTTIRQQTAKPSYATRLENLSTWLQLNNGSGTIEN